MNIYKKGVLYISISEKANMLSQIKSHLCELCLLGNSGGRALAISQKSVGYCSLTNVKIKSVLLTIVKIKSFINQYFK